MRQTLVGHTQRVECVAWSPDGPTLASGADHTIRLWDVEQGNHRMALHGHAADVYSLAFTPDSRSLLSGSEDGTLRLWEVQQGQCVRVLQGYDACLYDLDWSPDGKEIASAGSDSVVSIWQVEDLRGAARPVAWTWVDRVWDRVASRGGVLASSGWDHAIRLWDSATGCCLQVICDLDHPDILFCGVAWSPDGKQLASATSSRGVLLWEVRAGAGRWIGRELSIWRRRVAFSPDGTRLVGGAVGGHVYVWDGRDGTLLLRLAGHDGPVWSVAFSPDGTWLASGGGGSERGELFVWEVQRGERLYTFESGAAVYALAWSPSGEVLFSGGSDGRLRWWDVRLGECVRVQEAHQGTIQALKVSPDGSKLASCGNDGTIKLWDLHSGQHLRTLRRDRPYERLNITGVRGLTDAQRATLRALGAVEEGQAFAASPTQERTSTP